MIHSLLLAGCGRMGGALVSAWRTALPDMGVRIVDPALPEAHPDVDSLPADYAPQAVLLAVKPQSLDAVLPAYAKRFGAGPLYISIAAGKTLDYYARMLGKEARVIRAMPNLPAVVQEGITALVANANATEADRRAAETLFIPAGDIFELEDESLMHAVTAVSGSGPAYVFLFLEALTKAAERVGIKPNDAAALALGTVRGAAALAATPSLDSFISLRQQVTSPGGTTEAALKALMPGLSELMEAAVTAAIQRSKALAE